MHCVASTMAWQWAFGRWLRPRTWLTSSSRKTSWTYSTPRPLFLLPRSKRGSPVPWTDGAALKWHSGPFPCGRLCVWLSNTWILFQQLAILKQAHIPKDKPGTAQDGAKCASTLRPISVLSVFWRIWISAKMKLPELQTWYDSVLCPSQYGCRRKRDALQALIPMGLAHSKNSFLYQPGPSSSLWSAEAGKGSCFDASPRPGSRSWAKTSHLLDFAATFSSFCRKLPKRTCGCWCQPPTGMSDVALGYECYSGLFFTYHWATGTSSHPCRLHGRPVLRHLNRSSNQSCFETLAHPLQSTGTERNPGKEGRRKREWNWVKILNSLPMSLIVWPL